MQISDCAYVDKVFDTLRQKLCLGSDVLDEKTNVLIWRLFLSTTMIAPVHLGPSYCDNLVACRNTDSKELKDVVQHYAKIDPGTILGVSECIYDDMAFHPVDKIDFVSRSCNRVGESKGACLLRFRSLSGEDT